MIKIIINDLETNIRSLNTTIIKIQRSNNQLEGEKYATELFEKLREIDNNNDADTAEMMKFSKENEGCEYSLIFSMLILAICVHHVENHNVLKIMRLLLEGRTVEDFVDYINKMNIKIEIGV